MKTAKLRSLLLEVSMVTIGVFLALLADQWRENRQLALMVSAAEARIISEVQANYAIVLEHQTTLRERYEQLQLWGAGLTESESLGDQMDGFPGFPVVQLNDAAWQRANSSELMNYGDDELIAEAFELYDSNEAVNLGADSLFELVFGKDLWDEELTFVCFNIIDRIFRESLSQAAQARDVYERFVAKFPEPKAD